MILRARQGVLVVVVGRVDPALVGVARVVWQRLSEGPHDEVQVIRAVLELNDICCRRPACESLTGRRPCIVGPRLLLSP